MGLFSKREPYPTTAEEREGLWTRQQLMSHFRTISDGYKLAAMMTATEDQLRVLAWELADQGDRLLAINEAKQRRAHPELRMKFEEAGAIESPDDLKTWTQPLQEMHGRKLPTEVVDAKFREVFGWG